MAKSRAYRSVRFLIVCAVASLVALMVLPLRWSTTQDAVPPWKVDVATPATSQVVDPFPVPMADSDSGHLELPVGEILMPHLVPPDVHFIWCGERWFEFKNYLSVMGVRRAMQPDKIYIHYERTAPYDRVYYHQVTCHEFSHTHTHTSVRKHAWLSLPTNPHHRAGPRFSWCWPMADLKI